MTCAFPDSLKPFPNIQYKYITVFFFCYYLLLQWPLVIRQSHASNGGLPTQPVDPAQRQNSQNTNHIL